MRKFFFFSTGLIAAACVVVFFSDDSASSRSIKRPPKLRATLIFPQPKGSTFLGVSFSHASHSRFGITKCSTCHDDKVFSEDKSVGANKITMDDINDGKFCGHCHNGKNKTEAGKPIFAPKDGRIPQCVLCHNVKMRIIKSAK